VIPRVSIIIPAYNAEAWLAETLRSAAAQTWRNTEIIVVDDGSTDRTLEVAERVRSAHCRVVTQINQGAAAARNHALRLCTGDYIQWLDADDVLAPDKIEKQMELASAGMAASILLSSAWGSFGYQVDKALFRPNILWADHTPADWLFHKLDKNLYMMNASWLVSRQLTEKAGPWNPQLSLDDDGEYFSRVLLTSQGVRFTPNARSYYRRSTFGSLSNIDGSNRKLESLFLSLTLHTQYIRSLEDSGRVRLAVLKYLQRWLVEFYPERPDLVAGLEDMASKFSGTLEPPTLRWKYSWLATFLGFARAKRVQALAPRVRHSVSRALDRAAHSLRTRNRSSA
jgi:glycosyltransferase involved in cell wall biosynthesis